MQDAPHQLARNILEAELEMRVLKHRVVSAFEGQRPDRVALLVGDFAGSMTRGE